MGGEMHCTHSLLSRNKSGALQPVNSFAHAATRGTQAEDLCEAEFR